MPLLEVGAAAREQAIKREEREAGAVQIKKERLDDAAEEAGRASVAVRFSPLLLLRALRYLCCTDRVVLRR